LSLYQNLQHIKDKEFRKKYKTFIDNHVSKYYNVDVDDVINNLFGLGPEKLEQEVSIEEEKEYEDDFGIMAQRNINKTPNRKNKLPNNNNQVNKEVKAEDLNKKQNEVKKWKY